MAIIELNLAASNNFILQEVTCKKINLHSLAIYLFIDVFFLSDDCKSLPFKLVEKCQKSRGRCFG